MIYQQKIYLVDDDAGIRKSLARVLKLRGYSVEIFDSAASFLRSFSIENRGCLILDLSMPDMNGLELQQTLQQHDSTLPIIFISGYGDVQDSVKALKNGAVDFLEKPFTPELILEKIEEAFEQDRQVFRWTRKKAELFSLFDLLTDRELEVLKLMVAGAADLSNKLIARKLRISFRTVGHHRARIMEKTKARSITELARMADSAGITAPESEQISPTELATHASSANQKFG